MKVQLKKKKGKEERERTFLFTIFISTWQAALTAFLSFLVAAERAHNAGDVVSNQHTGSTQARCGAQCRGDGRMILRGLANLKMGMN